MKICFGFPSLESSKGVALLTQNRQFQWSKSNTVVFPVIPASAASLLHQQGHDVVWLDGIAEHWSYDTWLENLKQENPDILFIETKTPVIKRHWHIINQVKQLLPNTKVVIAGDHVTALPNETLQNCDVDYIISGGNFDAALLDITSALPKQTIVKGRNIDLNKLPLIDREITKWHLYAYDNGNFKYFPGTYIMAGRDCWWRRDGGCTFCSWTTLFPQFSFRSVDNVLDEIGTLINLGVKEVFDDTGTFIIGDWLRQFCHGMIERGYNKKIVFGCNMRFGYLTEHDYELMAKAGFRFILYGLESVSQETLNKLHKGTKIDYIEPELQMIQRANLRSGGRIEPHITCMVGYPWETKRDAQKTVHYCRQLFQKGLINSLQATIMIPYPGTQLFKEAEQNNWLKTTNWDDYDMKRPILKTELSDIDLHRITQQIYFTAINLKFIFQTITNIRNVSDIKSLIIKIEKFTARLIDFK